MDRDRNAIREVIRSVLGSIVENGGEKDSDSNTLLVETDNGTTDYFGEHSD